VAEALLRAAEELKPQVIVASGDFTQRAKEEQFAEARAYLDRLPKVPIVVTPGNHDVPLYRVAERLFSPYELYRKYILDDLNSVTRVDGAVFAAINTTDPYRRIKNGRIRSEGLDYCAQAFSTAVPETLRIVVAHHHFAPAPDFDRDRSMFNAKEALDRFTALKVDMVLGGHLHRAYIGNSLDVYPGADHNHGVIIVQSGTSTSRRGRGREREKNSFNLIRANMHEIHVAHYMYFEDLDGFAPISRHTFPRPGRMRFSPESPEVLG
jgi:3',5'-cyclic AMP phosphodiesterase CpdA